MSLHLLFQQAISHHRAGQLGQADEIYAFLGNADPRNGQIPYLRGLVSLHGNQPQRALEQLMQAAKLGFQQSDLFFQLGKCHAALGNDEAALDNYRQALQRDGQNVDALCNAANILLRQGRQQEALADYQAAVALAPDNGVIRYNLGTLYLQRLQPELAIPHFEAAIGLLPNHVSAHNSLGAAKTEIGELEAALPHFRKANALEPSFADPWFNAHGALLDLHRPAEAIASLEGAVKAAPDNPVYRFFLGAAQCCVGDRTAGEALLESLRQETAIQAELDSWDYLVGLGTPLPPMLGTGKGIQTLAMAAAQVDGLVLEFGVFNGKSIRQLATLTEGPVHGFDSFEGLPEAWGDEARGSYSAFGRLPQVPDNVRLHRGWFEDSIPPFLQAEAGPIRFINIDCDLYSSTKTIFDLMASRFVPGTVILFDEYLGYPSWREDEFKAFHEAAAQQGWRYELLGFSFLTKQAALRLR
ncbi:hypothetical protein DLREEDagrD3_04310 [Denitratisoma sp. agr-D3]